jgi:TolA-binding protein
MSRDSLSLYVTRGKRYYGSTLSVVLLFYMSSFFLASAMAQVEEPAAGSGDDAVAQWVTEQVELAQAYEKQGDYDPARQIYADISRQYPGTIYDLEARVSLAGLSISEGDTAEPNAVLEDLYADFSEHPELCTSIYSRANQYIRQRGDKATGLELHRYNADHFPESRHAMMSQGIITKYYLTKHDFTNGDSAMETFLSRFASQETLPGEVYKIAKYYYARAGRQDKAIELYQYIAKTWPKDEHALLSLQDEAISRINRNQVVAAQKIIENLLTNFAEQEKLAPALNVIAKAYHQKKNDEKALEYYQYVIDHWPDTAHALSSRGGLVKMLMSQGKVSEAKTDLHELWTDCDNEPGLAKTLLGISPWLRHYEDYDLATEVNTYILNKLSPSDNETIRAEIELAKIKESLGLGGYVLEKIRFLVEEYGGNPHLSRLLFIAGEEYYEKGIGGKNEGKLGEAKKNYAKALNIWQMIIDQLPDSDYAPNAHHFTAECHRHMGDYQKALEFCRTVTQKWPDYGHISDVHFMTAQIYKRMKTTGAMSATQADPKILAAYEQILTENPQCPMAKIVRKWQHQLRRNSQ